MSIHFSLIYSCPARAYLHWIGNRAYSCCCWCSKVDSHIQRIVLATEETTVTQQVSHRDLDLSNANLARRSQRGTKVNGSHHGDSSLLKPTGIQIATKPFRGPTNREHREFIGRIGNERCLKKIQNAPRPLLRSDQWAINDTKFTVLSTCPFHTNSGCGKEGRILIGPWWHYLEIYWPCAGGLSAVNVIGTQLRDPINSGLTRW